MAISRTAPARSDARHRIASYAVWEVVVFVLNVLAFVLIGLQLRMILARTHESDWHTYELCAGAVCLTVIVVRLLWVMGYNRIACWATRHFGMQISRGKGKGMPTIGSGLVVSWAGMRGIVTLAAALALPDGSAATAFPYRDLIILCAFCVVLSTLVIQGLTLRPLMAALGLKDDGSVEREVRLARAETARAALRTFEQEEEHPSLQILRAEYEARIRSGERQSSPEQAQATETRMTQLQRRAVTVQRRVLMELRAHAVIGDDAFHAAEEEIDLLELTADARIKPGPDLPPSS
jgi:CPA1 family monovalent cation:H+ antiporter